LRANCTDIRLSHPRSVQQLLLPTAHTTDLRRPVTTKASPEPRRRRKPRRPANLPEIVSPCISVCEMDEQAGICKGCYRTLAEIATWSRISNEDRWDIVQQLRERRSAYNK
jgi:predicted Fe-S protein YdhL (DUF1289 family)